MHCCPYRASKGCHAWGSLTQLWVQIWAAGEADASIDREMQKRLSLALYPAELEMLREVTPGWNGCGGRRQPCWLPPSVQLPSEPPFSASSAPKL